MSNFEGSTNLYRQSRAPDIQVWMARRLECTWQSCSHGMPQRRWDTEGKYWSRWLCGCCKVSYAVARGKHSHMGELVTPRRSLREPQHSPCLVKSPRVRQTLHVTAMLACPSHHPDRSNCRSPLSLVPPLFPLTPSSSPITALHSLMHAVPSSGSKVS
jgi:hypothetical protein